MIKPIKITQSKMGSWVGNEYATICPWNADMSRLLLVDSTGQFGLYDGNGSFIRTLPILASEEPRWSRNDPDLLYKTSYEHPNQLQYFRLSRNAVEMIHTFNEYRRINGAGESDVSEDGRHLVLSGNDNEVFVFDLVNTVKLNMITVSGFNSLQITPDNNVLTDFNGIWFHDKSGLVTRKITNARAHKDVCRDTNGDEVMIWTNAAEPNDRGCPNGIMKTRLPDGKSTCLLPLGWAKHGPDSMAVHISCPDQAGFALVSTYGHDSTVPYANQILKVALDGSGVEVVCDHQSKHISYNSQPKAAVSRDGSRFVFSSNNGQVDDPDYIDVWIGDIPQAGIPEKPQQPSIIVPPDRTAELQALQQRVSTLTEQLSIAQTRYEQQIEDLRNRFAMQSAEVATAVAEAERLRRELSRVPRWRKTHFTDIEIDRHWNFGLRPDRLLDMFDVAPNGMLSRVTTWKEGNEYKFRAVRAGDGSEAFEFYEREDNQI